MVAEVRTASRMTAEDLLALPGGRGERHELIRGELHTMPPAGGEHGRVHVRIGARLLPYVLEHSLGEVFGAETGFRVERDPDTIRAPDTAFLRTERWREQRRPDAFIEGPPDLAVEVVSPGDTSEEVQEKALFWLDAGTRLVWVVHPRRRTITVYWPDHRSEILRPDDMLDGGDVLPGFSDAGSYDVALTALSVSGFRNGLLTPLV